VGSTSEEHYANTPSFAEVFTGPSGHSLLPGGYGRSTFAVAPRTPMVVRGSGCHLWDDTGRQLIDVHNNFTALIHGNAHPEVVEAMQKTVADGAAFGLPNMLEVHHAQMMLERLRYVDQIRYTCSGTEAVMLAVRVARAATGRDKIVFVRQAYHGHSDTALIPGGEKSSRGVPAGVKRDVIDVPVNDVDALETVFDENPGQIAAVFVDPIPNRAGLITVSAEFWRSARRLCSNTDTLLVSDEVIGLRLGYEGAAMALGIAPDLIVMGKIIGGGTPVGAVAGLAKHMSVLDPLQGGLEHGGTFSGNPVTMAAGLATMRLFTQAEVDRLNILGGRLRERLAAGIGEHGWEVRGGGSLFRAFPAGLSRDDSKRAQTRMWWAAYDRGVLIAQNGQGALSTPMTEQIVDDVAERLVEAAVVTGVEVMA
jgi:glutamate-1-semialdehyde 2,1-aminomutase